MKPLTHFSIVVPIYNGAETLDDCLTALVHQDYPQDRYEVLVVDDGSTDDTVEIALRYPVRLISFGANQGRVVARNTGAREAQFETLVFNDVRVIPEREMLAKIHQRNYQPLIPVVYDYDGSRWGFPRFFFLLRCKIYAPYYPLPEKEFFITPANFDQVPKGAGNLVCDRELWLVCQPQTADKSTNDDTRILREIVKDHPILRATTITVEYHQRTDLRAVVAHTFWRGPRFADYYLRPGGRYYAPYVAIWLVLGLTILGVILAPAIGLLSGGGLLLLGLVAAALYLSQTITDFIVVLTSLPIIVGAFGLGILRWQAMQLIEYLVKTELQV